MTSIITRIGHSGPGGPIYIMNDLRFEGVWTTFSESSTIGRGCLIWHPFKSLPAHHNFLVQSVQIAPADGGIVTCGEFRFFINETLYGTAYCNNPILSFCKGQEDVTDFGLLVPGCNNARVDISDWWGMHDARYTIAVTGLLLREIC